MAYVYIGKQANTHSVPAMVEGWLSGPVNPKYLGDRVLLYTTVYTYPYRTTRLIYTTSKKLLREPCSGKKGGCAVAPDHFSAMEAGSSLDGEELAPSQIHFGSNAEFFKRFR